MTDQTPQPTTGTPHYCVSGAWHGTGYDCDCECRDCQTSQPTTGDDPPRRQWNATEAALVQGARDAEALAAVTQERDTLRAELWSLLESLAAEAEIIGAGGEQPGGYSAAAVAGILRAFLVIDAAARAALGDTP
jgi:hypothetical protein